MNINLRERNKETGQTKVQHCRVMVHPARCVEVTAAVTVKCSLSLLRYDDQSQNDHEKQGAEDQQGHRGKVRC